MLNHSRKLLKKASIEETYNYEEKEEEETSISTKINSLTSMPSKFMEHCHSTSKTIRKMPSSATDIPEIAKRLSLKENPKQKKFGFLSSNSLNSNSSDFNEEIEENFTLKNYFRTNSSQFAREEEEFLGYNRENNIIGKIFKPEVFSFPSLKNASDVVKNNYDAKNEKIEDENNSKTPFRNEKKRKMSILKPRTDFSRKSEKKGSIVSFNKKVFVKKFDPKDTPQFYEDPKFLHQRVKNFKDGEIFLLKKMD